MYEVNLQIVGFLYPILMVVFAIDECAEKYSTFFYNLVRKSNTFLQVDALRTQIDAALHDNYLSTTALVSLTDQKADFLKEFQSLI